MKTSYNILRNATQINVLDSIKRHLHCNILTYICTLDEHERSFKKKKKNSYSNLLNGSVFDWGKKWHKNALYKKLNTNNVV